MGLPVYCLLQTPDTLKARLPAPFDAGVQSFDPSQTLPVSVLQSEPKLMKVGDVKSMSWEQHVDIWKVCCIHAPEQLQPINRNYDMSVNQFAYPSVFEYN